MHNLILLILSQLTTSTPAVVGKLIGKEIVHRDMTYRQLLKAVLISILMDILMFIFDYSVMSLLCLHPFFLQYYSTMFRLIVTTRVCAVIYQCVTEFNRSKSIYNGAIVLLITMFALYMGAREPIQNTTYRNINNMLKFNNPILMFLRTVVFSAINSVLLATL